MRPLLQTLASAFLFGLCFPPTRAWPLAWIVLAPFWIALREAKTPGRAVVLAWVWSLCAAWSVGDWMPGAIQTYYLQPWLFGFAFFVAIASTMAAPYYAVFAIVSRMFARLPAALRPWLVAAAWVSAELGRGRLFTGSDFFIGNPWALVGYSQVGVTLVEQAASFGGVYALSFAVASANAGLAELWIAWRSGATGSAALRIGLAAIAPAVIVGLHGAIVLLDADATVAYPDQRTPIAIVQGDVALGSRWRTDYYGKNFDVYATLTSQVLARSGARVVFWPESSLTLFLEREPAYRQALSRVLAPHDAQLVAGAPSAPDPEHPPYFNRIHVIGPTGELAGHYDKRYLVPFAERFPFSSSEVLRRSFARVREFTPGTDGRPLSTAAGPAGVLVCNEAMLPELARMSVLSGATFLFNPSNDTWIPAAKFAEQQFDIVRLRAVEQRRWLVRASTSGPSAIIDPWGRVVARTEPDSRATLTGEIAQRSSVTLYGRLGDVFAFGCLGAAAAATVAGASRHRRAPQARI